MAITKSVCPVSDTFADVENLIYSTVHAFRRRYGHNNPANLQDMIGDAKVAYMKAYRSYDKSLGEFPARLRFVVWHHLLDIARKTSKYKKVQAMPFSAASDEDKNLIDLMATKEVFNFNRFARELSDDASVVVRLTVRLNNVSGLIERERNKRRRETNPNKTRAAIFLLLRKQGWDVERIVNAFDEVGREI